MTTVAGADNLVSRREKKTHKDSLYLKRGWEEKKEEGEIKNSNLLFTWFQVRVRAKTTRSQSRAKGQRIFNAHEGPEAELVTLRY